MELLLYNKGDFEEVISLPYKVFSRLIRALFDNCLKDKVMTPNQWLETAFHLCKQRWDQSVDWMETLPMSKVVAMLEIQAQFVEKMNAKNNS